MRDVFAVIGAGAVAVVCCAAMPLLIAAAGLTTAVVLPIGGVVLVIGLLTVAAISIRRTGGSDA